MPASRPITNSAFGSRRQTSDGPELGDTIPTFNQPAAAADRRVDITNLSALTSALGGIRTWAEIVAIALVAVLIVGGAEVLLRALEVPQYIMPPPSMIAGARSRTSICWRRTSA